MALTVSMYFLCSRSSLARLAMISCSCLSTSSLATRRTPDVDEVDEVEWCCKLRLFLADSGDSAPGGGGGFSLGGLLALVGVLAVEVF